MISLLYVDDDRDLLDIARRYLEGPGEISVDIRMTVQEGIEALATRHYDAIVSDYQMPDTDGITFLRYVRETHGDIPFIMLTGKGREQVVIDALNNGADFYLRKGGEPALLFTELIHFIKKAVLLQQTQKTLIEREQRYLDLQNENDLIMSVSPEGYFLYANIRFLETLGFHENDLPSLRLSDIIHESDLSHCTETFAKIISGESVGIIDSVFRTRNGDAVFVEGLMTCGMKAKKPQYVRGTFKDVTERRNAQNALKDSEARFRTLIDSIGNLAIQGYGPDGTVHYWNKANESVYGYTKDEAIGRNLVDLIIPPEMREFVREAIANGAKTGEMPPAEVIELMRKDGTRVPVFSSHAVIHIPGYEPEMFCLDVDFTERRKMEKTIRESDERYRSLVESTNDMVWEVDPAFRITYVSPKIRDFLGYEPAEVIGKTPFELMPPEEGGKIRTVFTRSLSAREPIHRLVSINLHKDGRQVILESSGDIIEGTDGTAVGYRGINRDITDQKSAERVIRESEQYLKTLLEFIPAGVIVVDAETHVILQANNAALELFGDTTSGVVGKICHQCICPVEVGKCPVSDLHNTIDRSERVLLTATGEKIPILKSVVQEKLKGRKVLIETFVDISERKQAEEALSAANRQLTLMTKITRHDILNNITIILGYLTLIRENINGPKTSAYFDLVESATKTIRSQIEFTRIFQDLGAHKPQWQNVHRIMPVAYMPGGIAFRNELEDLEIFGDPLLEKVFFNLLDNSVRHGKAVTSIRVSGIETPEELTIVWEDNGIGIPLDEKNRIFNRGYGKNTGLGLYLAREILALTGITITENGEPGKGARFGISVPSDKYRLAEKIPF